jgi:S1-C subfamily serine protease
MAHSVLKAAAVVVGLPAAMLAGMAVVGAFTDNGYVRFLVAAVVVVGVPLAIGDRLLPAGGTGGWGIVTDVCAVSWMAITCGFAAAGGATRPLLAREGDRLVSSGHGTVARGAYLLAGVRAEPAPAPEPLPAASGSASASASLPAADASGRADGSTAAAQDAGTSRGKTDKPASSAGAPAPPADKTPAELFKEVSPSVVTLHAFQPHAEGGGTGFLIDKDGTIATNHHVIEGATRVQVKFYGGAIFNEVELLVDEPGVDLALLRVDLGAPSEGGRLDVKPLPLANSDDVVVGERAIVIGNPLGLEATLTDGLVSSRRIYEGRPWIQFSAPIGSGNSGGPVLNMRGEVIGVTTASLNGSAHGAAVAQNLNLAVPINELKKLVRAEYPSRKKLGDPPGAGHW